MIHGPVGRRRVGKTTLADFLCRSCTYQIRFSPRVTLPDRTNGVNLVRAPTATELFGYWSSGTCVTIVPEHNVDETFMQTSFAVRSWYSQMERSGPHTKRIGFIVDEARFDAVRESEDLDWLFRCTDQEMMHVYLTVHRPKDLHPDIRAILDYWYVFHVSQRIDLDVLEDETTPIIASQAPTLKPREFFCFDVGEQKMQHWKDVRRECLATPPHHRYCSHVWKPVGPPPKSRSLNPMVDEADADFELL